MLDIEEWLIFELSPEGLLKVKVLLVVPATPRCAGSGNALILECLKYNPVYRHMAEVIEALQSRNAFWSTDKTVLKRHVDPFLSLACEDLEFIFLKDINQRHNCCLVPGVESRWIINLCIANYGSESTN